MRTLGAVLRESGKPLAIEELTVPSLGAGQVLVEVAFSGVCGSQLLEARGRRGHDPYLPHTLGHEGSGRVLAMGSGVTKVREGDHVVLTWIKGDGADASSAIYESSFGSVNSGAISTFLKHAVIAENRLVRMPSGVPFLEGALLGCAVPTGAGVVMEAGVGTGTSLAVFGCGGVGLCAIMMARALGGGPVIAVDRHPAALTAARSLGATHVVNALEQDPVEVIRELTQGGGVDRAIDAAGTRQTAEAAFVSVRTGGGLAIIVGNPPYGERMSIDPMDLIRGKRITGSWGGGCVPDRDIPRLGELYGRGDLPLMSLVKRIYPLEAVNQALDDLESGGSGRALLDMRCGV